MGQHKAGPSTQSPRLNQAGLFYKQYTPDSDILMGMDPSLERIRRLLHLYQSGQIPTLSQHEVNPHLDTGSRENYLYFTLPPCLNFQRNSPAMWKAALATWEDAETQYLFFPERTAITPMDKVRQDLLKHRLALQPNKHVQIWMAISTTLHQSFGDDPREVIRAADGDAGKLIHLLQVSRKKDFPYLCGPKLSNYWPYILSQYTDVSFKNMHEISIIPDTHVIQSSVHLNLVDPTANSLQVEQAWKELLRDSGISPVAMHPVLWNWSRNDFQPSV
jgi:hypothetical protein